LRVRPVGPLGEALSLTSCIPALNYEIAAFLVAVFTEASNNAS
jgi:hypothetical protein